MQRVRGRGSSGAGARWIASALALAAAAGGLALAAPADDAEAAFEELSAEYEEAQAGFRKQIATIREEEGELAALEFERDWSPLPAFLDQFAAKGEEYAGSAGAAPFWMFVLTNDMRGDDGKPGAMCLQALDVLLDDHQEHPRFLQHVEYMGGSAEYEGLVPTLALLETILARATSDGLRHRALLSRGEARMGAKDEATRKLAVADLKEVAEKAGENDPIGARAKGVLFEAEHLQIGCVAPDIVGEDLNGVPFKLSDYRGKVLVVDFWGDW